MYLPCLATNITSIIVAAFALRLVLASDYVSPVALIIVSVLFIVGQFLYFTHRFRPVAGTLSIIVIILSILLLRIAIGTSPFLIDTKIILTALIILQIIKLPIG